MVWVGFDPGGMSAFGAAIITDEKLVEPIVVHCVDEALVKFRTWAKLHKIKAVGIDAPMWWSTGPKGDRRVDEVLRTQYGIPYGTIQAVNSLRGAAIAQGALLAKMIQDEFPETKITETHPKALLMAYNEKRFADEGFENIDRLKGEIELKPIRLPDKSEDHKRDALISALAAREGENSTWPEDLFNIEKHNSEVTLWMSEVHYWWPELLPCNS